MYDGTKNRDLKLEMISDGFVTEQEFRKFMNINRQKIITHEYIAKKRQEI